MARAPVYLKVANVEPRPFRMIPAYASGQPEVLLRNTWGIEGKNKSRIGTVLQSSFKSEQLKDALPERNGFVGTVITAYGQHHHLIIRPDDIWLAILTQFNFYINCNAENLRSKFVAHKDKKTLRVNTIEFTKLAKDMMKEIHNNVVDKELVGWALPSFSTSTDNDTVVFAAALMATLKSYFSYEGGITCGIPSITLEGTQKDWLSILHRLDKLEEFGAEPTYWASLLRPILRKFVQAFDGEQDTAFWKSMVDREEMCGGPIISGWISYFCVWSDQGLWNGPSLPDKCQPELNVRMYNCVSECPTFYLSLDMIPAGFFDFELKLTDDMLEFDCIVVAGHLASLAEGVERDTCRAQAGWFVFTKVANEDTVKMQEKLKSQRAPTKWKSKYVAVSQKMKKDVKGKVDKWNEEPTHGSGCFCFNYRIFAPFLRN